MTTNLGSGLLRFLGLGVALAWCAAALADGHVMVPYFLAASENEDPNEGRQGFLRLINHSDSAGMVTVMAVDGAGNEKPAFRVALEARQTRHFNSNDLESNPDSKAFLQTADGMPFMGVGAPAEGSQWRLMLEADEAIGEDNFEALEYVRTRNGFLTTMHDSAREREMEGGMMMYQVRIFNPGSNTRQRSSLYLVNRADAAASVTVAGVDDAGMRGEMDVRFMLGGGMAAEIPSQALEDDAARDEMMGMMMPEGGLTGKLGDGTGKWQLFVTSDQSLHVLSLMKLPGGYISNLSAATSMMDFSPPAAAAPPPEPEPPAPGGEDPYAMMCEGLSVEAGRISYGPLNDDPGSLGSLEACATTSPLINPINELLNPIDQSVTTVHEAKWQMRADANSAWMDIEGTSVEYDVCPYDPMGTAGEYRLVVDQTITPDGGDGEPNRFKCSSNTFMVE